MTPGRIDWPPIMAMIFDNFSTLTDTIRPAHRLTQVIEINTGLSKSNSIHVKSPSFFQTRRLQLRW